MLGERATFERGRWMEGLARRTHSIKMSADLFDLYKESSM